jgi:hypothetical protein
MDTNERRVSVRIRLPAPELRAFVTFYYFVEAFEPLTDFLYPEWGNVRFSISGEWMVLNTPRALMQAAAAAQVANDITLSFRLPDPP